MENYIWFIVVIIYYCCSMHMAGYVQYVAR